MTLQEAFDIASVGLLTQKYPSQNSSGECLYRGPRGRKCAVGFLIPDELYTRSLEGKGLEFVREQIPELCKLPYDFLDCLQHIHDTMYPHGWREHLQNFAHDYKLSTAKMDAIKEPRKNKT